MRSGVYFEHPYSGQPVQLVRIDLKSERKMVVHFKAKGQRGRFDVHIHDDLKGSTPSMPELLVHASKEG